MTLARGTALLRLAKYVGGDNQRAARLDAERPLLQQRKAPGLWQVAVRLIAVDDVQTAPVPRARKIKIVAEEATIWAVITRRGRPTEQAIDRGETAIMDTIARSRWFATGKATLRIHAPTSLVPFAGSFEVAVPVFSTPRTSRPGTAVAPLVRTSPPTVRPTRQAHRFTDRSWSGHQRWVRGSRAGLRSATGEQSALQPLLNGGKTLPQPRCLGFAQPLVAPIHHPTRTLQKFGAGIILLQRTGDIADRP